MMSKMPITKICNVVSIISSHHDGVDDALTAAWVNFVSMDPFIVMVAIGHTRHTLGTMKKGEKFGVSYLTKKQLLVAKKFGTQSGSKVRKFEQEYLKEDPEYEVFRSGEGRPYLFKRALCGLDCEVDSSTIVGDHVVFFGKVLKSYMHPDEFRPQEIFDNALLSAGGRFF